MQPCERRGATLSPTKLIQDNQSVLQDHVRPCMAELNYRVARQDKTDGRRAHTSISMKHFGPLPEAGGRPEAEMYLSSNR